MNAAELEAKYAGRCVRRSSLVLFETEVVLQLLRDCFDAGFPFLGLEAFRLFEDGSVQPSMEFSSVSFGHFESVGGRLELVSFERQLRSDWAGRDDLYNDTVAIVREGAECGYRLYEVSIQDPDTGDLLFFRLHTA